MIHGDVVTITSEGILIHNKAIQPLGIFDKSMCWGLWSANPFEFNKEGARNKQYRYPNLVISPIHPSSWPFLLQLEISMSDEEGAFAEICNLLNEYNLSILYLECTTAGFSHAFCNVIVESTKEELRELRREKQDFDLAHPLVRISDDDFQKAQAIADRIAAQMFAHAQELDADLNTKNKYSFLHSWEIERESNRLLYHEKNVEELIRGVKEIKIPIAHEERVQYLKKQLPHTANVHYMQRLAYFSMYGGGPPNVPFPITYHADSALLKFHMPAELRIYGAWEAPFILEKLPLQAISIFNTQEKYLRLKPITPEILNKGKRLTRIDVDYEVIQPNPYMNPTESSKGLFREIGKKLKEHHVNLLHVDNKATRYAFHEKTGRISFVADIAEADHNQVRESIKSIKREPMLKGVAIKDAEVYPYPELSLFVSLHFGFRKEVDIQTFIETISREYGFKEIIVHEDVNPSTDEVLKSIGKCHAFLQIIILREGEELETVNFPWLPFEHGVAAGRGLPIVRLVDCVKNTVHDWRHKLNIDLDKRLIEFSSNASDQELKSIIRQAIGALSNELQKKRQAGG